MARKQHSLIGTRTTRKDRFRAGTSTQVWRPCNSTTDFDGGRLGVLSPADVSAEPASEQLTQPIRRTLPGLRPSRWTLFGSLGHLALGPPLRRRRSPRDCLSPVNLPNLNLSRKQPFTGEASGVRNFNPRSIRYWSPRTATPCVYRWPRSRSAEGGTRPRLRGSWRGADPSQPLVVRSHSRSIPATCTLAAGSSRGR